MLSRVVVSLETSNERGSSTELTHVVVGRIQFHMVCWTEGLGSSLVFSQSLPQFLARWASAQRNQISSQQISKREQERTCKMKAVVFLQPNFRSDSHNFCCIIFVRSESFGPVHIQEEGIIQGGLHESEEAVIIETLL